ncbi:MAG: DNA repair protein RadA [Georgenia sp.]
MAKAGPGFACSACAAPSVKWTGKCGRCGEFGTVQEVVAMTVSAGLRVSMRGKAPDRPARQVSAIAHAGPRPRVPTGVAEFDRVIGGGLVAGQVLLLSGEPGAGKSTLLLMVANSIAERTGKVVLYISGEESVDQLAVRASRIRAGSEHLLLADETDLGNVIGHVDAHGPDLALVIVDSVQTVASTDIEGRAGGVSQVMEVAQALTRVAKGRGIPFCLVGQVTKESVVAGPRALEHIVDATLSLDGDRQTSLRLLRTVKNRYGPADEVACFEQTETGLREVPDPSVLFRSMRDAPVPGTCVTITIEGRRAMLAEVQALVAPTSSPNPRRGVSGLDSPRVAMLIAVAERIAGLRLYDKDLFVATVGGMRLVDPASDLAICLAVASAGHDVVVPMDVAAIGEVTLSGDVRQGPMANQRVAEALRLGYRRIIAPVGTGAALEARNRAGTIIEVPTLHQAYIALQNMQAGLRDAAPRGERVVLRSISE